MPDTRLKLAREPGGASYYYYECPHCGEPGRVFSTSKEMLDGLVNQWCQRDLCRGRGTKLRMFDGYAVDVTDWPTVDTEKKPAYTYEAADNNSFIRKISEN
jgi:hypothetical protein